MKIPALLASALGALVAACQTVQPPPLAQAERVDLARFMGDWYVIANNYRIVYVSADYGQTIVGREKRDYVWIMARTPELSDADYRRLVDIVAAQGYDVAKLRKVPQRWSQGTAPPPPR